MVLFCEDTFRNGFEKLRFLEQNYACLENSQFVETVM